MRYTIYTLLLLLIITASCVPSKKLVYLQDGDELKNRDQIVKDSILRVRPMKINEYRIQPLDILSIRFESITDEEYDFFSKSELQNQQGGGNNAAALNGILVDADGFIEYIVVGKIKVSGLSVFEAQAKIQEIANQYLRDVVVRVRLLNFRFTILTESGAKVVTSSNTRINMMEAVGLAGGLDELADRSSIKVIRQRGSESEIFYVNLLEEKFIESEYYYIQQNDIIVVSPLKQRTFRKYFSQNLGLLTTTASALIFIATLLIR